MTAEQTWAEAQKRASAPGPSILSTWKSERERRRGVGIAATFGTGTSWNSAEFSSWVNGGLASAGVPVNERTAMSVGAVHACVSLIGGALASLPLHIYKREPDGQRARVDVPLWWLLNEQPAPGWAAGPFWEYLVSALLFHGDAFAEIVRPGRRSPDTAGFVPWHPLAVRVSGDDGRLKYTLADPAGGVRVIDQDDMIHVPGVGFDGTRGMSALRHGLRNSVGIALAADEFSAAFFKNGARPDFALTVPGKLTDEATKTLRETWQQRHGGPTNSHLPAVLAGGLDVKNLTMPLEDAQLIATRSFQVEEIARVFGVPPHMIGHTDKTTSWGSGVEQMGIGFVRYTLQRHMTKFQQEFNRKIWPVRSTYFCEFNVDALLAGDAKSQADYFGRALGGSSGPGWMTQDEVRRLKNLKPRGGAADTLTEWSIANESAKPAEAAV